MKIIVVSSEVGYTSMFSVLVNMMKIHQFTGPPLSTFPPQSTGLNPLASPLSGLPTDPISHLYTGVPAYGLGKSISCSSQN